LTKKITLTFSKFSIFFLNHHINATLEIAKLTQNKTNIVLILKTKTSN